MDPATLLHQSVLYIHLIAFAVTVAAVLREDVRWLLDRHVDPVQLGAAVRTVSIGLGVLWASGLVLSVFAAAASPLPWTANAKLCAKLFVVSLLTLNGWALHAWVLPTVRPGGDAAPLTRPLPVALGAVSSASWLFASFVGVARPLAGALSLGGFIGLYAASVGAAIAVALLVVRSTAFRARLPAVQEPTSSLAGPI